MLDQYDYDLPRELIAQHPLAHRADARLLVVHRAAERIEHAYVRDLPGLVEPSDCLVLNDTRVVPARLVGHRVRTGGRWSGLFVAEDAAGAWRVVGRTRGRLEPGDEIRLEDPSGREGPILRLLAPLGDGGWVARVASDEPADRVLERVGRVPLPPYIRGGEMQADDVERYQTVYAREPGSVAAPTAGLHFTGELLAALRDRGVAVGNITLHVGVGTFRPITAERLEDHVMHAERVSVGRSVVEMIDATRSAGGRVIAVGTTAVRALETASRSGRLEPFQGETDLFIRPPYEFRTVDALLTNFHLPRSTLLVLVRTFGGDALIRNAYQAAIDERYRFYSYGDAMLIL